ncbi:MAG: hypothetical protein K2K64_01950 [Muribaculaceae bacterium]|nr:hypothetical protein [Muribaculaceae bacterium]
MGLSEKFEEMLRDSECNPEVIPGLVSMVMAAPDTPERDGLLAMMYHDGIGVERDLDKSFGYAEKAAFSGQGDALGDYILGFMCEHGETPDQADGGPRQKYDHYDAERFYEKCAGMEGPWRDEAVIWLGDYFMDFAKGGDPEVGVEYFESIAEDNTEAAGRLSDYYWNLVMPDHTDDEEWVAQLYRWTTVASRLDPEEYAVRMGWLYADGLGCGRDFDKARGWFEEGYRQGDWRGADAMARLCEERLESTQGLGAEERERCEREIEKWDSLAGKMYEEELGDPAKEGDFEIEED